MRADIDYFNLRTQQEAIMAIRADAGPAQELHDEMARAYLHRLIDAFDGTVGAVRLPPMACAKT